MNEDEAWVEATRLADQYRKHKSDPEMYPISPEDETTLIDACSNVGQMLDNIYRMPSILEGCIATFLTE